ncbi:MAG: hypothetical protein R3B70_36900 [Polyangiaceae bacterium]
MGSRASPEWRRGLAIKVAHGDGGVIVERFRAEAEAMAAIGAAAVPRLVASGRTESGRPYLVMERLAGETLEARLSTLARPLARCRAPPRASSPRWRGSTTPASSTA